MITIGCYQPLLRIEDLRKWETAKDGHHYHPARIISGKTDLENYDFLKCKDYAHTWIPCGQCIGCRLDYSREWADRGYLEGKSWGENRTWFVTLTINDDKIIKNDEITTTDGFTFSKYDIQNYDDEWQGELIPRSMTLFVKRLRFYLKEKLNIENIRYMYCGEYGTEGGRPHYHMILFNCPLPADTFYNPRPNWEKEIYWQNTIIEELWSDPKTHESYGISNITEATWNTMAYVGRYITKKLKGPGSEYEMAAIGRTKEFMRVSTSPGIGWYYYDQHKDEIYRYDQILIQDRKGSHWVKPPKYFDKMFKEEFPDRWEEIKEQREKMQLNSLLSKAEKTSLTRWEQLQLEMRSKDKATTSLNTRVIKDDKRGKASVIRPQATKK